MTRVNSLSCTNVYSRGTGQHRDANHHTLFIVLLLWWLAFPASCTAVPRDAFDDSAFNLIVAFFVPSTDTSSQGHRVYTALKKCKTGLRSVAAVMCNYRWAAAAAVRTLPVALLCRIMKWQKGVAWLSDKNLRNEVIVENGCVVWKAVVWQWKLFTIQ